MSLKNALITGIAILGVVSCQSGTDKLDLPALPISIDYGADLPEGGVLETEGPAACRIAGLPPELEYLATVQAVECYVSKKLVALYLIGPESEFLGDASPLESVFPSRPVLVVERKYVNPEGVTEVDENSWSVSGFFLSAQGRPIKVRGRGPCGPCLPMTTWKKLGLEESEVACVAFIDVQLDNELTRKVSGEF